MSKTNELYQAILKIAPLELAEEWDNPGYMIGSLSEEITGVLFALDATDAVLNEASERGFNVVVTHHPLIFHKPSSVMADNVTGRKILYAAKKNLHVISMHTNLDKVLINDVLIQKLGAFTYSDLNEMAKVGYLERETDFVEYLEQVKAALGNTVLRYHDAGKKVYKIACLGGAGGSFLSEAFQAGCDTYITSDVSHAVWLEAADLGINLIDADHYQTENPGFIALFSRLQSEFPEIPMAVADANKAVICYG